MNVSLPKPMEEWINEKVDSGVYQSASEVVREALRLLREQDDIRQLRVQELRRQVNEGIEQLDRGKSQAFDSAVTSQVKQEGRKNGDHRSEAPRTDHL